MIRVLVVEDQPLMQEILADMLNADSTISVVGTAGDGRKAIEFIRETPVDVIVMAARMPNMDGIEATGRIMTERPCPIVVVHGGWVSADAQNGVRAREAGAVAVVEKSMGDGAAHREDFATRLQMEVRKAASQETGET